MRIQHEVWLTTMDGHYVRGLPIISLSYGKYLNEPDVVTVETTVSRSLMDLLNTTYDHLRLRVFMSLWHGSWNEIDARIVRYEEVRQEGKHAIRIYGESWLGVLRDRMIFPGDDIAKSLEDGTLSAIEAILSIVNHVVGDTASAKRKVSLIHVPDVFPGGVTVKTSVSVTNALALCQRIADISQQYGNPVWFRVVPTVRYPRFIISERVFNRLHVLPLPVTASIYTVNAEGATTTVYAGQTKDGLPVAVVGDTWKDWLRRESYAASITTDKDMSTQEALRYLQRNQVKKGAMVHISPNEYRRRWDLGDLFAIGEKNYIIRGVNVQVLNNRLNILPELVGL